MPRALTPSAARAVLARETDAVFLALLEIEHPDIETIRIVHNTEPVTRGGNKYVPYPFEVMLPEDSDSMANGVQLRADNVDRGITRKLRELVGIPKCTLRIVLAESPDVDEVGPFGFSILSAEYDSLTISLQLGYEEDLLNQAVPAQTYTPTNSPGMFR